MGLTNVILIESLITFPVGWITTQVEQYGPYIGRSNTVRLDVVSIHIKRKYGTVLRGRNTVPDITDKYGSFTAVKVPF